VTVPGEKYLKYARPLPPADPNQEFMTVQETAHELRCSVTWLRKYLKDHPKLCSRSGRRIITDRAARAAIYRSRTGVRATKKTSIAA
jgi:hypothetical protein